MSRKDRERQAAAEARQQRHTAKENRMHNPGGGSEYSRKQRRAEQTANDSAALEILTDSSSGNNAPQHRLYDSWNDSLTSVFITKAFPVARNRVTSFGNGMALSPLDYKFRDGHQLFLAHDSGNGGYVVTRHYGGLVGHTLKGGVQEIFKGAATKKQIVQWLKGFSETAEVLVGRGMDVAVDSPHNDNARLVTRETQLPQERMTYSRW